VGGDLDEGVTEGKVCAGEAALFRAEDKCDAAAAGELLLNERGERGQRECGLLGPAAGEGGGAEDEGAMGDGLLQGFRACGSLEEFFRADGGAGFAPVGLVGGNDGEPGEAEVDHGARGGADVERVARGDEDDVDRIEMGGSGQGFILERRAQRVGTLQGRMSEPVQSADAAQRASAEIDALCATARWCYARGWVPATSGNFSVRPFADAPARMLITPSGLDKGTLQQADLIELDAEGRVVAGAGKPSAETALHLVLYTARPDARAIVHVHSVWNTLLSGHYAAEGYVPGEIRIQGYEILKGLSGVTTHAHLERVPVLENTQEYFVLSSQLKNALERNPDAHGVILSRHGLYTWGQSVAEARRHLEALEFLFEVEGRRLLSRSAAEPDFLT
jgi:methylthioribulose-1-phosphate dehydratase